MRRFLVTLVALLSLASAATAQVPGLPYRPSGYANGIRYFSASAPPSPTLASIMTTYGQSNTLWFDPTDSSTVTSSGGSVSQITNKGTFGTSAVTASGSNQPTLSTINGQTAFASNSGVVMNGTNSTAAFTEIDFCTALISSGSPTVEGALLTLNWVGTSGIRIEVINVVYNGSLPGDVLLAAGGYNPGVTWNAPSVVATTPSFVGDGLPHVLCGRLSSSLALLYLDGSPITLRQTNPSSITTVSGGQWSYGGDTNSGGTGWIGTYGEQFMIAVPMTSGDFSSMMSIFTTKY